VPAATVTTNQDIQLEIHDTLKMEQEPKKQERAHRWQTKGNRYRTAICVTAGFFPH